MAIFILLPQLDAFRTIDWKKIREELEETNLFLLLKTKNQLVLS